MHCRLLDKTLHGILELYARVQSLRNPHTLLSPATVMGYNRC